MPRWKPLHPDFIQAIELLDSAGLPFAEQWRRLSPIAARLDVSRPSYWLVRRTALRFRPYRRLREERRERIIRELLAGLVPRW